MSRSGYSDDCEDQWATIRWRGAVKSAINGKRGQAFLRELLVTLDAMPDKTLTTGELEADGEFCTLGAIGKARGVALEKVDTWDWQQLADVLGISEAMAREIMFENDESVNDHKFIEVEICGPVRPYYPDWSKHTHSVRVEDPEAGARRWQHMREWVASQLIPAPTP